MQPAVDHPPIHHRERYRNAAAGMQKCAVGYTLPGHLAQYLLITEETIAAGCVVPLPDQNMPAYAAALCEPISCVISAQNRHVHFAQANPQDAPTPRLGLTLGGVTVVVGAGPMGRMHAEAALRFRPRHLMVSDLSSARLSWLRDNLEPRCVRLGTSLHTVLSPDLPDLLRMVAQDEFDPAQHLALVGSLDQFPRALEMVKLTETEGKIVLYPHIRPI